MSWSWPWLPVARRSSPSTARTFARLPDTKTRAPEGICPGARCERHQVGRGTGHSSACPRRRRKALPAAQRTRQAWNGNAATRQAGRRAEVVQSAAGRRHSRSRHRRTGHSGLYSAPCRRGGTAGATSDRPTAGAMPEMQALVIRQLVGRLFRPGGPDFRLR